MKENDETLDSVRAMVEEEVGRLMSLFQKNHLSKEGRVRIKAKINEMIDDLESRDCRNGHEERHV